MKLTLKQLKQWKACTDGTEWFKAQKDNRLSIILPKLVEEGYFTWANWTVVRLMTHPQKVLYAINAAETVLEIYEKRYPEDKRPRKAVEAARGFLRGEVAKEEARAAADDAAYADAAAAYADAAAAAADAAAAAADAAAAAADAAGADAAAAAAYAAYAAGADARRKFQTGQIRFAMNILGIV